ncbi:LPS assembly lipoprotein LptE [Marinomonas spartinae]|uniref:LPS-assembly lipoprotein LptE n=1 Tax=Marinomonas spartinae TaxID=1792290 RepID=UPI0018F25966|nr:LPS assembly lipoprotein LptE [Marinomonas spartinae]MBJ7554213.1 hypothetical protein [Marinomonas spartinae]
MIIPLNKTTRFLLLIVLSFSVVACGFHLRGQVAIPESLKRLVLTSDSGSPDFDTALRIALTRAGVKVVDAKNAGDDVLELKVNHLKKSDTVLARNSSNDVTQIQRELSGVYFIRQKDGKSIYGPRNFSTTQILSNQNAEESTKSAYNQTEMQTMANDLANQLVSDLAYAPVK